MGYAEHVEQVFTSYIAPLHEVRDDAKMERLIASMRANGWQGRPLLVVADGNDAYVAMTGSHRCAAAREAGLETVPCVVIPVGERVRVNWRNDVVVDDGSEDGTRLTDDDERLAACIEAGLSIAAQLVSDEIRIAEAS